MEPSGEPAVGISPPRSGPRTCRSARPVSTLAAVSTHAEGLPTPLTTSGSDAPRTPEKAPRRDEASRPAADRFDRADKLVQLVEVQLSDVEERAARDLEQQPGRTQPRTLAVGAATCSRK